jgi:hypothetical protein
MAGLATDSRPNADEEGKEGRGERLIDVVDAFRKLSGQNKPGPVQVVRRTYSQENVRDVHGHKDGDTNIRELSSGVSDEITRTTAAY